MNLNKKSTKIYRISKTDFIFETVGIIGIINKNGEFCWAMDLYAQENEFEGVEVSPKFSFTELEETRNFIKNKEYIWENTSAYSKEKDDWIGSFYIFDAHFFKSKIQLIKKNNESFDVIIKGKVNLNWETAKNTDSKNFHIENNIPFNGILCEIEDKEECLKIAGKFINIEGMKWIDDDEKWLRY